MQSSSSGLEASKGKQKEQRGFPKIAALGGVTD